MNLIQAVIAAFKQQPSARERHVAGTGVTVATTEILSRNAERLMRTKGVMSVGVGRTPHGEPAIVIGTDRMDAEAAEALPTELEGIPIIRHQIGHVEAQDVR
ncbi:MAG: hypothetical protein JW733_07800 [Coriobacteriia bacterium]|nr:hypothetical protein [Coriobacteriia bacterium]MBN2848234.1 hypothetical protein [Coriobacteriia bacterium]